MEGSDFLLFVGDSFLYNLPIDFKGGSKLLFPL